MKLQLVLIITVLLGIVFGSTASASYAEDLKGKSQLEVIEYWLAEQPLSQQGKYQLKVATDAWCNRNTIQDDYAELRMWVKTRKDQPAIVVNQMIRVGVIPQNI